MGKSELRTVRFTKDETGRIDEYLKINPIFESFSALARVATLTFMEGAHSINVHPISTGKGSQRPRFLWDYDLTDAQVREVLKSAGLSDTKKWLIERILTEATFDEVMDYLDVKTIADVIDSLRLPQKIKDRWSYAIKRWSENNEQK